MLRSIQIGNFKAFAETQRIPIRPLTLIYGANSSGKSSILHGLILARHAMETGQLDAHQVLIGGDSVDLGGFAQYVHRRKPEHRVEWAVELNSQRLTGRAAELLQSTRWVRMGLVWGWKLDDFGKIDPATKPGITTYELETDQGLMIRASQRDTGTLRIDRMPHDHPVMAYILQAIVASGTTSPGLNAEDMDAVEEALGAVTTQVTLDSSAMLPRIKRPAGESQSSASVLLAPISRANRKDQLRASIQLYLPRILGELLQGLADQAHGALQNMVYLGPLRSYPPRHLAFLEDHADNWRSRGGQAWEILLKDANVRERVNHWLSSPDRLQTPYRVAVKALVPMRDMKEIIGVIAKQLVDLHSEYGDLEPEEAENLAGKIEMRLDDLERKMEEVIEWGNWNLAPMAKPFLLRFLKDQLEKFPDALADLAREDAEDAAQKINELGGLSGSMERLQEYIKKVEELEDDFTRLSLTQGDLQALSTPEETLVDQARRGGQHRITPLQVDTVQDLILEDLRTKTEVSHRDVGIGISQVLPVLVQSFAAKERLVAIEQPEIHLHPALQADLADVFIDSALGGGKNHFLIETHSEHLLLRIMRRMRETAKNRLPEGKPPVRPEDVMVLYVEPVGTKSIVREMPLNEHGELVKAWPGGFFEEGLREVFE